MAYVWQIARITTGPTCPADREHGARPGADDFQIAAPAGANAVTANVIGVVENQAPTTALKFELPVTEGRVQATGEVCQIALVERHRATGTVVNAFVSGFGYQGPMAMASTVAHDSHHMIVVGTDADKMALAANRLREVGGGITIFKDGAELALVELPIAGLMSDSPASEVAAKAEAMMQAMRDCGCTLNNAYMQHSLLALVVIPELRISDLGLVDVRSFEFIPLLEPAFMTKILTPDARHAEQFTDATAAVDRLTELYSQATSFLRDHFQRRWTMRPPKHAIRAFYPEIRFTTSSYAQVDTRLSFGHVSSPGTFSATITRPELFRTLPDPADRAADRKPRPARDHRASDTPIPVHFAVSMTTA